MRTEPNSRVELPSQDEARAIVERARRMRAEALARMLRAGWSLIARRRPAERPAGRPATMPLARA